MKETIIINLLFVVMMISNISCSEKYSESVTEDEYKIALMTERAEKDFNLKNDPHSPFNRDPEAKYAKLKYFDPDTNFIFKSKLYRFETIDTITIMGTRGEQKKAVKEGYVNIKYHDQDHKLNVYKSYEQQGQSYYSIWFTDETSGEETYHIGRYLDFNFIPDEDFVYTVDFNYSYNPYCAYSELFTCPIPTEEDHLNFKVLAGEKNFK